MATTRRYQSDQRAGTPQGRDPFSYGQGIRAPAAPNIPMPPRPAGAPPGPPRIYEPRITPAQAQFEGQAKIRVGRDDVKVKEDIYFQPTKTGEKAGDDSDLEMPRSDEWGGDRRTGDGELDPDTGFDGDDLKDATDYHRQRNGKREFKGKSPLATSKGSTLVAREGLLGGLKKKFGKDIKDKSIINEEILINDE